MAAATAAPEESATDAAEARLGRILELRRELDELMGELSPAERRELARRLAESSEPEPPAPEAPSEVEETPAATPPQAAPVTPGPASDPPTPEPEEPAEPTAPRCGTLEVLDDNADGVVSGADRNWRYLSLWRDDGDGVVEEQELKSLFDQGIRRVSARLFSYTTSKDVDGGVWVEDTIYFDLSGRRARATLVIDATRLARGGSLWLEDAAGERLEGAQALRAGLVWVRDASERTPVLCR